MNTAPAKAPAENPSGRTEIFWKRIQEEVGDVPVYLQNIINFQQLAATKALGILTREDIHTIEDEMRKAVSRIENSAAHSGKALKDFYGSYSEMPSEFRFSIGDVRILQTIVATVQQNGVHKLLSRSPVTGQLASAPATVIPSEEEECNALKTRIKFQLTERCADDAEIRNKMLQSLDNVQPKMEITTGGKIMAKVTCPTCSKMIKIVRDPPRSWPLYNFMRHLNRHLPNFSGDSSKKKRSNDVEEITFDNSNVIGQDSPNTPCILRQSPVLAISDPLHNDNTSSPDPDTSNQTDLNITSGYLSETSIQQSTIEYGEENNEKKSAVVTLCIEPVEFTATLDEIEDGLSDAEAHSVSVSNSQDQQNQEEDAEVTSAENMANVPDKCYENDPSFHRSVATDNHLNTNSSDTAFLNIWSNLHEKTKQTDLQARRYSAVEKDICAFEYLTTGNAHYEYVRANVAVMSKKTIQRHMKRNTIHIKEGIVDAEGLKAYLIKYGFPLVVVLCEDGTKITSSTDYDYNNDSITGLVAPMGSNGLPMTNLFKATTPYKMASDLKSYPIGSYAYIQMAIPLSKEAAPYVLYHACSNNQFSYTDVLNRWDYTESLLNSHGITVLANASDGDTRLMKAMRIRAGFDKPCIPSPWGSWFRVDWSSKNPINVQDMTHTVNKFRNRLLNGDMTIGIYKIKKDHLEQLIANHSKDKHGLCVSDIYLKDKMKFDSTEKLMKLDLQYFEKHIPNSKGTALFIDLMRRMYRAFDKAEASVLDRIENIWTALFVVRGWRNFCKHNYNNLTECITSNAYHCLELDAHAIILFVCICRDQKVPEQFIVEFLSSQPCENLFRELRSLSSTHQTVVNFSIKELTEKLKRIHMTRSIMYKNRNQINFPFIDSKHANQHSPVLPSNDEIIIRVQTSKTNAEKILLGVGIEKEIMDLSDSVCNSVAVARTEFVEVEDFEEDEITDTRGMEYMEVDDSFGEQEAISKQQTGTVGVKDSFLEQEVTTKEQIESVGVEECLDGQRCEHDDLQGKVDNTVYEANKVFSNCDEMKLKNSLCGQQHAFRISDSSGRIKNVKKSTLLWMLTDGRKRLSADRMRRFQQN